MSVPVYLGEIAADTVRVELCADADERNEAVTEEMTRSEPIPDITNAAVYRAALETPRPAWHFTPRVVPFHPDARVPIELRLVAWQR